MGTTKAIRVLVVVSAADQIPLRNGRTELTGTYLGELIEPTDAMRRARFELAFATPGARVPVIDGASCSLMYFAGSRKKRDAALSSYRELLELGLATPAKLDEISTDAQRLDEFDALFVPGGHAPLVDLLHRDAFADDALNDDFGALVRHFHDARRPTGLICHAPAALAAAPTIDGRWTYAGYRMTCFKTGVDTMLSTAPLVRRFKGRLKDDPTELLTSRGAKVEQTFLPMGSKVVEDRELITGQDPYSAKVFGAAFVKKVRASLEGPRA